MALPEQIKHVPLEHVRTFAKLGAIHAAIPTRTQFAICGHTERQQLPDLVYFFDVYGRELGYWSSLQASFDDRCAIFVPNFREWSPSHLNQMDWYRLPPLMELERMANA